MRSSFHVDNRKKYILILFKRLTQKLDGTTLTAEAEYSINFREQRKEFRLNLHWNEVNSYLFVNGFEIYKFKAKDSEINAALLCLDNVSVDDMRKTGLYRYVYDYSVDYNIIDVDDILDICIKCLDFFKKNVY